MRRPTTRLAYWTVIFRWPRSTNTMIPTTSTIPAASTSVVIRLSSPRATLATVSITPLGKPTTIPAKINRLIPLPIPRSVICSPSHMIKAEPVVRVSTVIALNPQPGFSTILKLPDRVMRSRYVAMAADWISERIRVP